MSDRSSGGEFQFRVSDSLAVPLRGYLLRLKLLEGRPSMSVLAPGRRILLVSPGGERREVTILAHGATGGRASQKRLDEYSELDVIISTDDAGQGRGQVAIGWIARGPVS